MTLKVSIVGGSGYTGGELLRLLLGHPQVMVQQVTSQRFAEKFVHSTHPNLRRATQLKYVTLEALQPCDLLFVALPHGEAARQIEWFAGLTDRIVDLSADFRLRDPALYQEWYGWEHPHLAWLERFVYGLPELHREELAEAQYVSGVGCNATAVILALLPLVGLMERVVVEVKVGSSEGGNSFSLATHHPERSGVVRSFAPTGHRHQAEVLQALQVGKWASGQVACKLANLQTCRLADLQPLPELHFSATAVELVRGVLCTAHVFLRENLTEKEVWRLYRQAYGEEPFIRLVKDHQGLYRYPEPKILAGTNFCDIGFAKDERSNRLVVISALDNLMKGAAGTAVQAMNVMMGWPEEMGLGFVGLHPV